MDAFAELYRVHASAVRSVVLQNVADRESASDIVQEAFARALDRLGSLRDGNLFRPWLMSIARHAAIDQLRTRAHGTPADIDSVSPPEATGPGPDELAQLAELSKLVRGCISGLSARDATAVALVTDLGFSPAEVGAALGVTAGAAKVVVHRARRRLAEALSTELLVRRTSKPSCNGFDDAYDHGDMVAAARHVRACAVCVGHAQDELQLYAYAPATRS